MASVAQCERRALTARLRVAPVTVEEAARWTPDAAAKDSNPSARCPGTDCFPRAFPTTLGEPAIRRRLEVHAVPVESEVLRWNFQRCFSAVQ